ECNAVMMSKLYDGVEVMLKKLKESGRYAMCVASSKYEPAAIESLTRFNVIHYFDNVYAQNERRGFKNEILAQLISENGYDKQTCLMIGDTHYDIDGARENSLDVVGVTYGFESRQQIVESKPDAIVDSALELLDLLLD
ncbi:MAG: HAD hydrolase-like protein, partial [Clostridia bacterium]